MTNMHAADLDNQSNFRDNINKYLKYWYLFVIAVISCFILAFLYIRYATPMYQVDSALLIKGDKKTAKVSDNNSVNDLQIINSAQSVDNKIQELKSKTLIERVIQELSLQTSYFLKGSIKDTEIYGKSVPVKVEAERITSAANIEKIFIKPINDKSFELQDNNQTATYNYGQKIYRSYGVFKIVPASNFKNFTEPVKVKFNNIPALAAQYLANLTISSINENTDVVDMSFVTPVPEKGIDILNKIIEVANKEELEDKNKIARNTIKFINERLEYLTQDLANVEKNVENLKQQNDVTDVNANAQMYLDQSGAYSQQLANADVQLSVLRSVEDYMNRPASETGLVPSSLGINDATLNSLISRFNELQLEKQRILRTAQPGNPVVTNIDEQLAGLKTDIRESLKNIRKGLTITRNSYAANTSQAKSKIKSVPAVERELQEIQRQQGVKQSLYQYLLQKREESALALAATVNSSRVIEQVNVNPNPVAPKKQLIYLCALLLGLGIPAAGIYTKDLFNNKIQSIKDVQHLSGIKILGELSHNETKGSLVVNSDSRSTISELFRLIRTNLKFHTAGIDNKVILVTSTRSGEGKTFFCSNLASTLALTDKKAVVLEFDLRNPMLLNGLGINSGLGISNYIKDNSLSVNEIIRTVNDHPNLYAIGSGPITSNPAELLLNDRVEQLIGELKQRFDYIILDTSPVGQVADAFSLVPYSDSSIYLVRYNYTTKSQLSILNEVSDKLKNPMIVLNDAEVDNYKGYGYGYGYVSSNKKLKLIG